MATQERPKHTKYLFDPEYSMYIKGGQTNWRYTFQILKDVAAFMVFGGALWLLRWFSLPGVRSFLVGSLGMILIVVAIHSFAVRMHGKSFFGILREDFRDWYRFVIRGYSANYRTSLRLQSEIIKNESNISVFVVPNRSERIGIKSHGLQLTIPLGGLFRPQPEIRYASLIKLVGLGGDRLGNFIEIEGPAGRETIHVIDLFEAYDRGILAGDLQTRVQDALANARIKEKIEAAECTLRDVLLDLRNLALGSARSVEIRKRIDELLLKYFPNDEVLKTMITPPLPPRGNRGKSSKRSWWRSNGDDSI